ncbi:MAG: DNA-binding protein [Alphaproteobacteria bacterium]|nr:DNA-binding protein [Alphaproteobacteria bacterium]
MINDTTKPLLSPKDLAARWGCSERLLDRQRIAGTGPAFIRVGTRHIRYPLSAVEAWEAARQHTSRAAEMVAA